MLNQKLSESLIEASKLKAKEILPEVLGQKKATKNDCIITFITTNNPNNSKNCGKNCISCPYRLKASLYLFKRVNKSCLLENSYNCKNSNTIYIVIFRICKKQYTGKMGRLVKQRTNIYRKNLIQPQHQQLTVEEHLLSCGDGKFHMFPFFKMLQENESLRKSYWDYFIDKF